MNTTAQDSFHRIKAISVAISVVLVSLVILSACFGSTPEPTTLTTVPPTATPEPPTPTPVASAVTVQSIADDITAEVGTVRQVVEGDPDRMVFIFEETHDSPSGQIEIAMMLNRLYERYALRSIGLEGFFAIEGKLRTEWFDPSFQALDPIRQREDVIVQFLEDGEISSSEMMALTYADIEVVGIESEDEYNYEPPDEAWSAATWHLFQIAAPGMTQSEIAEFNKLVNDERILEAIELAVNSDTWTAATYASIQDETTIISAEEWLDIIDSIEAKATEVGAEIEAEDQANLQSLRQFFEVASRRSKTMVAHMLNMIDRINGVPVAMVTGAAHTELIMELLTEEGISFAVLRGNALQENQEAGDLTYEAYDRKTVSQSVDPAGALGALLDGRKKPQPVIGELWFQSKANVFLITTTIARAAAAGDQPPFVDALSKLPPLEGVTLDQSTIQVVDGDVIFRIEAINQNGDMTTVWVRTYATLSGTEKLLEDRLLEAYDKVQAKNEPSPEPEPPSSEPILTPVSSDTLAKFASSETKIKEVSVR